MTMSAFAVQRRTAARILSMSSVTLSRATTSAGSNANRATITSPLRSSASTPRRLSLTVISAARQRFSSVRSGIAKDPLVARVDIHMLTAKKAYQGHPGVSRELHGQARRRRNGRQQGNPGHQRLLCQLKAGAPGREDDVRAERKPSLRGRPSDDLVERIVATDIFTQAEQLTGTVEQCRGMQPPGARELPLRRPLYRGQAEQEFGRNAQRVAGHVVRRLGAHSLDARLAAHAARRG